MNVINSLGLLLLPLLMLMPLWP